MSKYIYVLYVLYTHDINDIYEADEIGYFESRELAEEAMKTVEPEMKNRRKEIIENQQKLFGEDPKELEKLYSDEFVLSIDKLPLNVIEWNGEI